MNFLGKQNSVPGLTNYGKSIFAYTGLTVPPNDYGLKILQQKHIELYGIYHNTDYKNNRNFNPQMVIKNIYDNGKGTPIELNFAFGFILCDVGYDLRYVRCFKKNSNIFHLGLIVKSDNKKDEYYIDVGSPNYFKIPIPLNIKDETNGIRIAKECKNSKEYVILDNANDVIIYRFNDDPVLVSDIQNSWELLNNFSYDSNYKKNT